MRSQLFLGAALAALTAAPALAQTWTPNANKISFSATAQELMSDGTVLVQSIETPNWWKLTPDNTGSYVNGTWSQVASMPSTYGPLYDASQVLPDGRLIINGGEYNLGGGGVWTTKGAIYDPVANSWTSVTPPKGWTTIGDAQSILLNDGTYLLANCCTTQQVTLNLKTMAWTAVNVSGKADINDEEGWTLLPDGSVLTVDANNTADLKHTERFVNGGWVSAGDTISELPDLTASGGGSHEMGPQVLRPDGTVFAAGATGHTGVYNTKTGVWSAGPDFPKGAGGQEDIADGPGALEPDGHVLMATSPGVFNSPTSFFEWTGKKLASIPAYPNAANIPSYQVHFLVLPNGQIMATDFSSTVMFFTPKGIANKGSAPKIVSIAKKLTRGTSYVLKGVGLAGKSQGAAYGDDFQSATNYPMVRITNTASGHVFYARATGLSSYAVANLKAVTTNVVVPAGVEAGASTLVAVTNGIASAPVDVTIQ